mmetsp:Transcript_34578/g.46358  ORF Transcript_34578/g.46358 Transcript_34578/m.46358 type:complete len:94 (+) Transcript_34578:175-456(+)
MLWNVVCCEVNVCTAVFDSLFDCGELILPHTHALVSCLFQNTPTFNPIFSFFTRSIFPHEHFTGKHTTCSNNMQFKSFLSLLHYFKKQAQPKI